MPARAKRTATKAKKVPARKAASSGRIRGRAAAVHRDEEDEERSGSEGDRSDEDVYRSEDEEDVESLDSDALDEESDGGAKGPKKRKRAAPRSKKASPRKASLRKKRKRADESDEDDDDLDLKEGQEVVGIVVTAPTIGWGGSCSAAARGLVRVQTTAVYEIVASEWRTSGYPRHHSTNTPSRTDTHRVSSALDGIVPVAPGHAHAQGHAQGHAQSKSEDQGGGRHQKQGDETTRSARPTLASLTGCRNVLKSPVLPLPAVTVEVREAMAVVCVAFVRRPVGTGDSTMMSGTPPLLPDWQVRKRFLNRCSSSVTALDLRWHSKDASHSRSRLASCGACAGGLSMAIASGSSIAIGHGPWAPSLMRSCMHDLSLLDCGRTAPIICHTSIKALATSLGIKRATSTKSSNSAQRPPSIWDESRQDELTKHVIPCSELLPVPSLLRTNAAVEWDAGADADGDVSMSAPVPGSPLRLGAPALANARLSMGNKGATTTIRLISAAQRYDHDAPGTPQLPPFQTNFDLEMGSPAPGASPGHRPNVWPASPGNTLQGRCLYPLVPFEDMVGGGTMTAGTLPHPQPHVAHDEDDAARMPGGILTFTNATPAKVSAPLSSKPTPQPADAPDMFSPMRPPHANAVKPAPALRPRSEPFLFGSPLPRHSLSNKEFGDAAASVLEEMNRRVAEARAAKGGEAKAPARGVQDAFADVFSAKDRAHQRTGSTDHFAKAHEDAFGKMDSIVNHYAARRPPQAQVQPNSKKRKSDALGIGPAPGAKRKSSAAGARVISAGCLSNKKFGDAAASVLEEMNRRVAKTRAAKGGKAKVPARGVQDAFADVFNASDKAFAKAHEDAFGKMDSIATHYDARHPSQTQAQPNSKKRKSDALGIGPAPGANRKSSAASAHVISTGVRKKMGVSGAFGADEDNDDDSEEDPGDHRSSKRILGQRVSLAPPAGADPDAEDLKKQKEREAIRRKLDTNKARRCSSRGRVSIGGKPPAGKAKTSCFGFLASAKSLPSSTVPVAKPAQAPKPAPEPKPARPASASLPLPLLLLALAADLPVRALMRLYCETLVYVLDCEENGAFGPGNAWCVWAWAWAGAASWSCAYAKLRVQTLRGRRALPLPLSRAARH
ncbi:predicted protein [Postia placenta Mad-698-R]|nr:predicted protein [Postia placenta Mad-698-R]